MMREHLMRFAHDERALMRLAHDERTYIPPPVPNRRSRATGKVGWLDARYVRGAQPALVIGRRWLTTMYLSVPVPAVLLRNAVVLYRCALSRSVLQRRDQSEPDNTQKNVPRWKKVLTQVGRKFRVH